MAENRTQDHWWRRDSYPAQSCSDSPDPSLTAQETKSEAPPLIPSYIQAVNSSEHPFTGRTIIICLDGTGDKFDNDNSNVVHFMACLKKDLPNQITYYQSGIGTYDGGGMTSGFSAAIDAAIGSGLGVHIRDAYTFLMQNYCAGDRICLLGFSRGSYTVRCLVGMLHKVGLLPAYNTAQVGFAYKFYKDETPEGWKLSAEFKKTFCQNVVVYFVGLFDCVASVGLFPRKLPFSKSPSNVEQYFRHAMALDEHRAKFKICQWLQNDPAIVEQFKLREKERLRNKSDNQKRLEAQFETDDQTGKGRAKTDVKEVWFTGAHCDVGGGAVPNGTRHQLSRIPLRWMIRQCFQCNTGILFNTVSLAEVGIDVPTLWPVYKIPRKPKTGPSPQLMEKYRAAVQKLPDNGRNHSIVDDIYRETDSGDVTGPRLIPEQAEDHFDALAPIFDQLMIAKGWWILEFWPIKVRVWKQNPERWEKVVRPNMGRFRPIREHEPMIHWTVQARMSELGYKMRNQLNGEPEWRVVA